MGARQPSAPARLRSMAEAVVQELLDRAGPLERQGVVDALPLRLLAHRDNRRGDNRVVQKPPQSEAGGCGPLRRRHAAELPDLPSGRPGLAQASRPRGDPGPPPPPRPAPLRLARRPPALTPSPAAPCP